MEPDLPVCGLSLFIARDNKTRSAGRNLSDKQLRKVSEMLGQEWELVAIHLELTTIDLDVIKADRQTDVAMQKYKMLVRWRGQRPPGEATAQDLQRGLEDLEDLPVETRLLLEGNVLHAHTHTQKHTHTHTHRRNCVCFWF